MTFTCPNHALPLLIGCVKNAIPHVAITFTCPNHALPLLIGCVQNATVCADDHFINTACTKTENTICKKCDTACGDNFYMSQPCTATANRECTECSVCADDHFINTACTKTENTICEKCDTACGDNFYMSQPCTATANRECTDCTVCEADQYMTQDCGVSTDRECTDCTVCEADQYMTQDCGVSTDRECADCSVCADDHFINTACTETENTICGKCDTACGDNFYMSQPCTATANRECTECSVCADDHFINTACTKTENTICEKCDTACGHDFYMSQPCTATANRVCTECSVCGADQYMSQDCSSSSDRVCITCSPDNCAYNQYYVPCTSGSVVDASCVTCAGCPAGSGLTSMCTADADTVCTPCLANQYQKFNNWYDDCVACNSGEYSPVGSSECQMCTAEWGENMYDCIGSGKWVLQTVLLDKNTWVYTNGQYYSATPRCGKANKGIFDFALLAQQPSASADNGYSLKNVVLTITDFATYSDTAHVNAKISGTIYKGEKQFKVMKNENVYVPNILQTGSLALNSCATLNNTDVNANHLDNFSINFPGFMFDFAETSSSFGFYLVRAD